MRLTNRIFTAMRNFLLVLLFSLSSLTLYSGFFYRNEGDKYPRNNPTDKGAENYQGYETVDSDGDGQGDFVVWLNNSLNPIYL